MTGEKKLGLQLRHLLEGGSPLHRVALNFLGVAAVRTGPDKEIPGAQSLLLRNPDPGGVVSLALVVAQVQGDLVLLPNLQDKGFLHATQ